ncbi:hypothetical protein [Streptomyces sp. ISL-100]|uniref:hypothetical protein n=1 Tax=Streptomyces sp. ISL-100 TaxID=2819173 RepID=UPI001BE81ACC|nr:hypothetical protein [Streptomyces sp. ISL-100]MBT2400375.1 hypothetical protein [Streptomyces sp. ISL-100]
MVGFSAADGARGTGCGAVGVGGREDTGRWRDRDDDRWRDRDDDHWRERERERERGRRSVVEDVGRDTRDRFPRRVDLPRQSRRDERDEQEDLKETIQALRSELTSFVEALRDTSVARDPASGQEPRRS